MSQDRVGLLRLQRAHSWDLEEWFVPLAKALKGLTASQAAWQPPGGGNTIWQTLRHINHYNERLLSRMTGAPLGPSASSNEATFGEPGAADDAAGWAAETERAIRVADGLRQALESTADSDLDQEVAPGTTIATALASWMMHDAYHTGQIVLIRKQQGSWGEK